MMGYDLARFQGDVDEELICPICSGVLEEPLQVSVPKLIALPCVCVCVRNWGSATTRKCSPMVMVVPTATMYYYALWVFF